MHKDLILERLESLGQRHLALQIDALKADALERFWLQLRSWDLSTLQEQRNALLHSAPSLPFSPLETYDTAGSEEDQEIGLQAVRSGKVGCLILAGGQGSRLNAPLPKALVPVLPVSGKCLLEIFCDKRGGADLPLAVMASPLNHAALAEFLQGTEGVDLFQQKTLPFLDDAGNWMLQAPGQIAEGPDGNGHALKRFFESGIWEAWKKRGVEHLVMIPIDNPLADPYDAQLVGSHIRSRAEATLKCVFRHDPAEKVGVVGMRNGKVAVQEYSELPEDNTAFHVAHIGIYCFCMEFIEKAAAAVLPLHMARKTASVLLGTSKGYSSSKASAWKCERFIFDVLDLSQSTHVIVSPRETSYSPLKNEQGEKSLKTVQEALLSLGYQ